MTDLRLALLGPPVVLRDSLPVTFDTRKAVALLALLAVTGREHSREQLADLLWPEADSAKGRASLRRTLSVTAAAMGAGLTISRAAVTLELGAVQVDVREFEALIARRTPSPWSGRSGCTGMTSCRASSCAAARTSRSGRRRWPRGCGRRSPAGCSAWWRRASRRAIWNAPPGTPGAGCSSIPCTSPPIRPSSGCTAGPASALRPCGSTGRWSACWTGTWPSGRCPRRLGCTTTYGPDGWGRRPRLR